MKFSLPAWAMSRPIAVSMIVITFIGMGVIASIRTPVEFLPEMDLPFLGVFIPYPGGSPAQVEQEIAIPAEGEFRTIRNLKHLYTNSNDEGCFVSFLFEWGTYMPDALAEVRDRIERLRLVLPRDADRIFVRHFSSDTLPVMQIGLASEGEEDEFVHLVRNFVVPKLQRLNGVAEVKMFGAAEPMVMIEFDQQALLRHKLSIYQVVNELRSSSINVSVGELIDGGTKHFVRALGEFRRPADLAKLTVGQGLRLEDVADVNYKTRIPELRFAIDGRKEVFLIITKESEANTVEACEAVLEELERLLATPEMEGTQHFVFFNQGSIVVSALNGLRNAGQYGGVMALVVLFLFLGRLRPTVTVALAIPGSLVAGLVFMFFADMSLNLVTMMSLIIAIGMVVDNSIVVIENIYRYEAMGYSPEESARKGASEVAMAIIAATSTTAVVFVPVLYMQKGQLSVFMRQFAAPVTMSLIASLVIALTVIPLAVSRFKRYDNSMMQRFRDYAGLSDTPKHPPNFLMRMWRSLKPTTWVMNTYIALLRASQRWRLASLLILAALIGVTYYYPLQRIGVQSMPSVDRRVIDILVNLDANYDLEASGELFDRIEAMIDMRREELGIKHIFRTYTARNGQLNLYLKSPSEMPAGQKIPYVTEDVMNILWELLPHRFPGGELVVSSGQQTLGGPAGRARVSMRLRGDDTETLEGIADRLVLAMNEIPELTDVAKSSQRSAQELRLKVDEVLANQAGINPTAIAQTVSFALLGTRILNLRPRGEEVPVWAQFREEDRKTRSNLDNVMVLGSTGRLVPLNQLVSSQRGQSPKVIERFNGKNFIMVRAKTAEDDVKGVNDRLENLAATFDLPSGYSIGLGDELLDMQENMTNFMATLLLAIVFIFIVMSALFESVLLPLSILTSVPIALVGVYWIMFLTGTAMDTVSFIGVILMVGVVVNNGIVIVDRLNHLHKGGMNRLDAIVQAGRDRLRPVLMTAITTILGAVPLAAGIGTGAAAVAGLGRAMIGGLTAGTFLTLFVVPLFYSYIDDFGIWCLRYYSNLSSISRPIKVDVK